MATTGITENTREQAAHAAMMTRVKVALAKLQEEIAEHEALAPEEIGYSEVTLLGVLAKQIEALYA